MIIARFWYITTLLELGPVSLIRIEFIGVRIIVIINNTSKYYNVLTENGRFMMTNISGASSRLLDDLPATSMLGLLHQFVETLKAEPPHVVHRTYFNISSSMDVKVIIDNEATMISTSLR
jgi:hypothetical protein